MNEQDPTQSQAIDDSADDSVQSGGVTPDYASDAYAYPESVDEQYILSPEEQVALEQAGLTISDHVPQTGFIDAEHYVRKGNNFNMYFMSGGIGAIMRDTSPAFKRFLVIRPELATKLLTLYAEFEATHANSDYSERTVARDAHYAEHAKEYYEAYQIMTALVDASDPDVMREDKDGNLQPDSHYLTR